MTEPALPAIGLGTYENTDPDECARSVETALNLGYRHVDTAEYYDNESAVGDGVAAADVAREAVFLATKVDHGNLAFDDVREHARASLARLGSDYVDLLYVHWPVDTYDPGETLAAFDQLHGEGVTRQIGLSNFTPALLDEALDRLDASLFAHQVECHPLLPQDELRAHARENGYTLVAYSPLAKGAVCDVPVVRNVAEKHGATPAQVSIAWLCSKENVVTIPKSATPEHIEENYAARHLELDDEDLAAIDAIERRERQVDFPGAPWN